MAAAYDFVLSSCRAPVEGESLDKADIIVDKLDDSLPENYTLTASGTNKDAFLADLAKKQIEEKRADVYYRYWEVIPARGEKSVVKLAFSYPYSIDPESDTPHWEQLRLALIEAVTTKLLSPQGVADAGLSYWYMLDEVVYGVWPRVALDPTMRLAAKDTLAAYLGLGGREKYKFRDEYFSHYWFLNSAIKFPLPSAGAVFLGVCDSTGLQINSYDPARHKPFKFLSIGGGFAYSQDATVAQGQSEKVTLALRLSAVHSCRAIGPDGKPPDRIFSAQFNRCYLDRVRAFQAAAAPVPQPQPNGGRLPRLDWSENDIFNYETCVQTLLDLVNASEDAEYRAAYAQLNKWFVKEGYGKSGSNLWCKTYDENIALKDVDDPELRKKAVILHKIGMQTVKERLAGVKVPISRKKSVHIMDLWIQHPEANCVGKVVWYPAGGAAPQDPYITDRFKGVFFNRWRGWDYYRDGHHERIANSPVSDTDPRLLKDLKLHELFELPAVKAINGLVYGVLSNSDPATFRIATLILANVLQFPNNPCRKVMIFKGEEGVGKSLLSSSFVRRVFGSTHACEISDSNLIIGGFNTLVSNRCFIVCEEAFFAGDKQGCNKLKQIITSEHQNINEKYGDIREEINLATYWMNTNSDFPVNVDETGRRWCFSDVCPVALDLPREKKEEFFGDIVNHLRKTDGIYQYAYFLTKINLEEWLKVRDTFILNNDSLGEMKRMTMVTSNPVHSWLQQCISRGTLGTLEDYVTKDDLDADGKKIGTKREPKRTVYEWGKAYPIDTLFRVFAESNRTRAAAFATVDQFHKKLYLALKHAKGFNPKYKEEAALVKDTQAQGKTDGKKAVSTEKHVKMPEVEEAKKSFAKLGAGLDRTVDDFIDEDQRKEKKLRRVKSSPHKIYARDLLPKLDGNNILNNGKTVFTVMFGAADKLTLAPSVYDVFAEEEVFEMTE
jgi:hypothetical protein